MAAGRGRLRPGGTAIAAALVILATGSGIAVAQASYDGGRQRAAQTASAGAALSTLERRAGAVTQVLAGPPGGLALLRRSEVPEVLTVAQRPDGPITVAAGFGLAASVPRQLVAAARTAMEVARDTGQAQAGPLTDGLVPVAAAVLAPGAHPTDTDQRRRLITSWRVALVSPAGILAGLPATRPRAVGVRVGGLPVGSTPRDTSAGTVLVDGQPWTLYMGRSDLQLSRGAVGTLAVSLLAALLGIGTDIRSQRALRRARDTSAALERETRTVAELGPLLQSSLDLAEVLPAVGLRLADQFGLSRLCVQLVGEKGRLLDVFAIGPGSSPRDHVVDLTPGANDELPADAIGAVPLLRAGRTIGRLTFTSHRPLGQAQLAALFAAADLIAVATYNVELYEREQASVRRLRELDQLKDAFLSTISHELRTPLTAISGFIRLLRDRWDQLRDEQRKEFLDRVHGNTLSLGLLVDDLLDFARLERQAINAPPMPMDLDQEVARTLAQLEPVLGTREVVSDLEPVRAIANAGALERVLANLLTNAAKFSPVDSRVVVTVRRNGQHATLEVADEGAGISVEDRERVFARFYRGDSNAARATRGAGIGLSVVRELVHQMGGTVTAHPNAPRGTRMVVRLPLESGLPVRAPTNGAVIRAERSTR